MSELLHGPLLKVERAKDHLRDLDDALDRFFKSDPYEIGVQDNADTGRREWRVVRADSVPPSLALIAGDAIHNARSALDHLVCQLVADNGGKPEDTRCSFPVWKSKAAHKSGRPGDAKGICQKALDILYGLKPYDGGNDALWRLHQLDIVDKHRLMLTVAAAHRNVIVDPSALFRQAVTDLPGMEWAQHAPAMPIGLRPADDQIIEVGVMLYSAPPDDYDDDVKFTIQVAISEPKVVEREPLLPMVRQLVDYTESVIEAFRPAFKT